MHNERDIVVLKVCRFCWVYMILMLTLLQYWSLEQD